MDGLDEKQFAENMKGAFGDDKPVIDPAKPEAGTAAPVVDYTPLFKELGVENLDALKAKITATASIEPDYNKFVKDTFGYDNVELTKAEVDKAKQLETILPEYNTLKNQTLTPFAKIANELEQKGVKPVTIARFHGLDLSKLSDADVIALSEEIKTPQLNKDQIHAIIDKKYGTDDEMLTDTDKLVRGAELTKEASIARGELTKYIADVFNPSEKNVNPELLARETSRANYWQQNVGKVDEGNFKIERPLKVSVADRQGKKDLDINFSYEVKPEIKTAILNDLKSVIQANPDTFTADGKGMDNANAYVRNRLFAVEGNNIIQAWIDHSKNIESRINEHYSTLLHNPIHRDAPNNIQGIQTAKEAFNKNAEAGLNKVTGQ